MVARTGVGNRVIVQLLVSVAALSVLFAVTRVAVPRRETTALLVSQTWVALKNRRLIQDLQERNIRNNNQDALDVQFPSTLTLSERGEMLNSLQTLLGEREAKIPNPAKSMPKTLPYDKFNLQKTRPCGFGRFASISCDKQEQGQILSQHSTPQQFAGVEAPTEQAGVVPHPLGDLRSIKKEMEALEAEVTQQQEAMEAGALRQHAEMEANHAEIEKLKRMQVLRDRHERPPT
jgi:hypothetical protein